MTIEQRMALTLKSEKIVGGREVEKIRNWAFIGNLGGYCGGSLIGDSWVFTRGANRNSLAGTEKRNCRTQHEFRFATLIFDGRTLLCINAARQKGLFWGAEPLGG